MPVAPSEKLIAAEKLRAVLHQI
jgi:hypothetical protein